MILIISFRVLVSDVIIVIVILLKLELLFPAQSKEYHDF